MKKVTIFIDESGTLSDPLDKVIVVAAVGIYSPEKIKQIIKNVKRKSKIRKDTGEFKFYTAGERSKNLFFKDFYGMFVTNIISEKKINWSEARKKLFDKGLK